MPIINSFGVDRNIINAISTNIFTKDIDINKYREKLSIDQNKIAVIYSDFISNKINPILLSKDNKFIYKANISNDALVVIFFEPSGSHKIQRYKLRELFKIETIEIEKDIEVKCVFAEEDKILFCETNDRYKIGLMNYCNSEVIYFQGHKSYISNISASYRNSIFASIGKDKTVKIWDIRENKCNETIEIERYYKNILMLKSLNSYYLIGWEEGSGLWIWDLEHKNYILNENDICPTVVYNYSVENNEMILIGKVNGFIDCFSITEKKYIWSASIHDDWVYTIKSCSLKNLLLTSSEDGSICLINASTGKVQRKLIGHEGGVWNMISFENVLITSGFDETIRIWDLNTNVCHTILMGHVHKITQMFITSDKEYLISCDKLGCIFAWKINWKVFLKTE